MFYIKVLCIHVYTQSYLCQGLIVVILSELPPVVPPFCREQVRDDVTLMYT